MTKETTKQPHLQKQIIILVLYAIAALIILLGAFFGTFCIIKNISFPVLNTSIHGAVFGVLVAYMGIRNFLMIYKFETPFYESTERFSWKNFKRQKKQSMKLRQH